MRQVGFDFFILNDNQRKILNYSNLSDLAEMCLDLGANESKRYRAPSEAIFIFGSIFLGKVDRCCLSNQSVDRVGRTRS